MTKFPFDENSVWCKIRTANITTTKNLTAKIPVDKVVRGSETIGERRGEFELAKEGVGEPQRGWDEVPLHFTYQKS